MKLNELLRMIDPRTIVSVGIKMLNGEFLPGRIKCFRADRGGTP